MPNHHWRCPGVNTTNGKPCRNRVSSKGQVCYRHVDQMAIESTNTFNSDEVRKPKLKTEEMSDEGYESIVLYVQRLRDENELLKHEVKALRNMFKDLTKLLNP